MEKQRKLNAAEIALSISRLEKAQKRTEDIIHGLPNLGLPQDFFLKKHDSLCVELLQRQEEIKDLKKKEQDFLNGHLDHLITEQKEKIEAKHKLNLEKERKIKEDQTMAGTKKKDNLKKMRDKDRSEKYPKNSDRDYAYFLRIYEKANETLPDYIRENLANMPNNKGYIWRDCWFFGDLDKEEYQPTIMFEKQRGGNLIIHEVTKTEYKMFEKDRGIKKLISRLPRRKINKSIYV